MRQRFSNALAALAMIFLAVACRSDRFLSSRNPDEPVRISLKMEGVGMMEVTRSVTDGATIYISANRGATYKTYTYDASTGTLTSNDPLTWGTSTQMPLVAVYRDDSGSLNTANPFSTAYTVTASQHTFLAGSATATYGQGETELTLTPQLAKVCITVNSANPAMGYTPKLINLKYMGTPNFASAMGNNHLQGGSGNSGWTTSETSTPDIAMTQDAEDATKWYAYVMPQAFSTSDIITLTNNNTTYLAATSANYTLASGLFAAGMSYDITAVPKHNFNENITVELLQGGSPVTATTYYYNGSPQYPTVVVKDNGITLTAGTDYTVNDLTANSAAGEYTVTVTGAGNYSSNVAFQRTATYTINKVPASLSFTTGNLTFSASEGSNSTKTISGVSYSGGTLTITSTNTDYCTCSYSNGAITILRRTLRSYSNNLVTVHVEPDASHTAVSDITFYVSAVGINYRLLSSATSDDVGKIICKDGHIHEQYGDDAFCTNVAIIVYLGEPGTADASSTEYKGLAMALTNASRDSKWIETVDQNVQCINTYTYFGEHYTTYKDMKGIEDTNYLAAGEEKCAGHTHSAAIAAKNYDVERPDGCSQWFLPTTCQWFKFFHETLGIEWTSWGSSKNGAVDINTLTKFFEDVNAYNYRLNTYLSVWTCSDYSKSNAFHFDINAGGIDFSVYGSKEVNRSVRTFFAF